MIATCETCRFWQGRGTRPLTGNCRRFPPPVTRVDRLDPDHRPITAAADWCGEHRERTEEAA